MPESSAVKSIPQIKKRIVVSQKRQITIPIEFFNAVGMDREVECYLQDETIVIRPVSAGEGEFDEQILEDLIEKGFSGEELLAQFKVMRRKVRPAVENLLSKAQLAAEGKSTYSTYEDVFGQEEK